MARTNLLFLFTDEQRADTMAAYGNERIQTPNLNRLARESTVFGNAYVTQPVCTPSRSTIMTGLYPHTSGCVENNVPLPDDVPCLPEMLPEGEYATGYFGKWHLGDEIFAQHGFEEWISIEDMYIPHYSEGRDRDARSSYHHYLVENGFEPESGTVFGRGQAARLPERYSKPAFLAQETSRFIRENRDRPWVAYVNFLEPHMPFFGPRDDQHDPSEVRLPDNFEAVPTEEQPLLTRLLQRTYPIWGHSGLPLKTETDWRRMIANYWGLCSLVDTYVGRILATLEDCGLDENTVVVYTSDHGDMMGSHQLLAKCVMFEEAVRVPLLLRLPGQTTGRRVPHPVSQVDLVATLLDLMGHTSPDHLQGASLRRAIEEDAAPPQEDVFIEWNGRNASGLGHVLREDELPGPLAEIATMEEAEEAATDPVRTIVTADGWKLNWSRRGDHELYNLAEDPGERRNLAAESEMRPLMRRLADRIRAWQQEAGDETALPGL